MDSRGKFGVVVELGGTLLDQPHQSSVGIGNLNPPERRSTNSRIMPSQRLSKTSVLR